MIIIFIISTIIQVMIYFFNYLGYRDFMFPIISGTGYSIQEVLEKYLMHIKFQSPFKILFIERILGSIIMG